MSRILLAVLLLASAVTPGVAQIQNYALRLNDPLLRNQYVSVTSKAGLQGNSAYTLEAWVYPTSYANYLTIVGNDFLRSFWLGLHTDGHVLFIPTGLNSVEGATLIPLQKWTHVAVTYDAVAGAKIYVNGSLDGSFPGITGPPGTSTRPLCIGADSTDFGPDYFWRGALDQVRIWNVARTPAEILQTQFADPGNSHFHAPGYAALVAEWNGGTTAATPPQAFEIQDAYPGTFVAGSGDTIGTAVFGSPRALATAIEMGGVDDYCDLGFAGTYPHGYSISAWIAPYDFTHEMTIVGRDRASSFWFGITPSKQLRLYPSGGGVPLDTGPVVTANQWQHVEATYDGITARIYRNGTLLLASTAVSGAVGVNGKTAWVGADHASSTPSLAYHGLLDQVRVLRGAETAPQMRESMYQGFDYDLFALMDQSGFYQLLDNAHFGELDHHDVYGSSARLVPSGAPCVASTAPHVEYGSVSVNGGLGSVPEDTSFTSIGTDLFVASSVTITSMTVFVCAPLQDLSTTTVTLKSPAATTISLLAPGATQGRNLRTVFTDAATGTLANTPAPFDGTVKPSTPLSAFNGQNAHGTWRLTLTGSGVHPKVGLSAWGIRFNNLALAAEGLATPTHVSLANRSANPSRDGGTLEFALPRDGDVDLSLFDAQGRRVATLFSGRSDAGVTRLRWNGASLAPGLYLARLRVDGHAEATVRLTLMR